MRWKCAGPTMLSRHLMYEFQPFITKLLLFNDRQYNLSGSDSFSVFCLKFKKHVAVIVMQGNQKYNLSLVYSEY